MMTTDDAVRESAPAIPTDAAWAAVLERDRRFDGEFFYAVRTTGVYCRPSCPARRPRRANVSFYATPDAAEHAGFRACHRCQPRSSTGTTTERRIRKAIEYLDAHRDEPVTLDRLARAVGLSAFHLQRTFKQFVGLSPKAYQDARRFERLKAQLKDGATVSRATYDAGFGSSRSVYEQASAGLGMTPGEYRRGGQGLHIRCTAVPSAFGRVLVGTTDRGVCAVALGEDDDALETELRREFPGATIARDDGAARAWVDAVVRHLEGEHPGLAVPLDLHGTAFQLRVWKALQAIPYGETRSYKEIAAALGRPAAARAVARACASNRTALVVPCHRVVRGDGAPGGYRWGAERKQRLLEWERTERAEAPGATATPRRTPERSA